MSLIPRDATVVIGREFLLDIARTLKTDPAFQMNFLMDLTAVDFSVWQQAIPAFFSSSGVPAKPSPQLPDPDPWPGPPGPERFVVVYHFFSLPLKTPAATRSACGRG